VSTNFSREAKAFSGNNDLATPDKFAVPVDIGMNIVGVEATP
jgi:hypothetical protein